VTRGRTANHLYVSMVGECASLIWPHLEG
jgi:hypothetical protein